jgi:hypothetical protein
MEIKYAYAQRLPQAAFPFPYPTTRPQRALIREADEPAQPPWQDPNVICTHPYTGGPVPVGCGKCLPCRINKRRTLSHRLMLESYVHDANLFVTLTYNDAHLPSNLHLDPLAPRLWLKRVRRALAPRKVRAFTVGEYGEKTGRAHYHVALFNTKFEDIMVLEDKWSDPKTKKPIGTIHCGDITAASANYIAGYVTKKMTNRDNFHLQMPIPRRNRHPEFARYPNNPGLGGGAMKIVADAIFKSKTAWMDVVRNDVPHTLRHGSNELPLGSYLRQVLRNELGVPDEIRQHSTYLYSLEMSAMLKNALEDPSAPITTTTKSLLQAKHAQPALNQAVKLNIHKQDRPL